MIVHEKDMDITLHFMQLNNRPQEEVDRYLQDQKDIASILEKDGYQTFSQLVEKIGHEVSAALNYLVKSGKISFSINSDGSVAYWDWGDY